MFITLLKKEIVRVKNTFVMHSFYLSPPLEVNNRPIGRAHLKSEKLFFCHLLAQNIFGKKLQSKNEIESSFTVFTVCYNNYNTVL